MSYANFDYRKYAIPRRRRYQALGLTVFGKPPRRAFRVSALDPLTGRERHAEYMRRWRAGLVGYKFADA